MNRSIVERLKAKFTSDGEGVKLLRVFGGGRLTRFDPFLMLDEFGSKDADDYIGGFPSHPHRGFQTVTYMLKGKMEHRDHLGNVGLLSDGGVQWMSAGKGVIHSEMPKQTEGEMRGFQLWVNLPAAKKLTPAWYQDIPAENIPVYNFSAVEVKAIAGDSLLTCQNEVQKIKGLSDIKQNVLYLDITLAPHAELTLSVEYETALIYTYEQIIHIAGEALQAQHLARLSTSGNIVVKAGDKTASFLVIAGEPIKEPIVQYGPFVMNTKEEIEQAIIDYQRGEFIT